MTTQTLWTPQTTTTNHSTPRPTTRPPAAPHRPPSIKGPSVTAADERRLLGHLARVKAAMDDGAWHTLRELAERVKCSEPSASARLRDLRRIGFVVERRRTQTPGVWEYSVRPDGGRAVGRVS